MSITGTNIEERVKQLGENRLTSVKKEIAELHTHLYNNEEIYAVASGMIGANTWLITISDKRVLCTYCGLTSKEKKDIPISEIKNISLKSGMLLAELNIEATGETLKITNVAKELATKVDKVLSQLIHGEIPSFEAVDKVESKTQSASQPQAKKSKLGLVFVAVAFVAIIGYFLSKGETQVVAEKTQTTQTTTQASSQNTSQDPEMPWTVSQLIAKYDALAPTMNLPRAIHKNTGEQIKKTIIYDLSPFSVLSITCNKGQDKPTGIMFLGAGDGSQASGAVVLLSAMALVYSVTPDIDEEARGNLVKQLGLLNSSVIDGKNRTVISKNIEIQSSYSNVLGLNVIISPL